MTAIAVNTGPAAVVIMNLPRIGVVEDEARVQAVRRPTMSTGKLVVAENVRAIISGSANWATISKMTLSVTLLLLGTEMRDAEREIIIVVAARVTLLTLTTAVITDGEEDLVESVVEGEKNDTVAKGRLVLLAAVNRNEKSP